MSKLERRPTRKQLERRAYRFGVATAVTGVATLAVVVLAVFGVSSFGLAFLLALMTAGFGYGFKATVKPKP